MADCHAHQINPNRISQNNGKSQQHPGQIGRRKIHDPKQIHSHKGISSRPHIHQHDSECLSEEQLFPIKCKNNHNRAAKNEQHHKITTPTAKRPLLQHPTILVRENHVEEETESHRSEEQKRRK